WIARPGPTDRHVQDDEERVIEHPLSGYIPRRGGLVQRIVYVPSNRARLPLDGIDVKTVGEPAGAQLIRAGDTLCSRVAGAMHGTVHPAGLLADVFHDVDLAAPGPPGGGDVVTEHPECRPQALPARDLNPCLHAAVPPCTQTLGLQSRRRVVTVAERLPAGFDDQLAAFETRVVGAVGVELELAVPPAVAPGLPDPFPGIEGRAIELVVPHELPAGTRKLGGACEGAGHTDDERNPGM